MMLVPEAMTVMSANNMVADVREVRDQVDSLGTEPGELQAGVVNGVQGELMKKPWEVVVGVRDEYCKPGGIKPINKLPNIFNSKLLRIDKIEDSDGDIYTVV